MDTALKGEIIPTDQSLMVDVLGVRIAGPCMEISPGLPLSEWEAAGLQLQLVHRYLHWWIGDWLNYGEREYGETYAQAIVLTGNALQTLKNDKHVASVVPPEVRRAGLSWSHHAEVARLAPERQDVFLGLAEERGWDRATLRAAVRERDSLPVGGEVSETWLQAVESVVPAAEDTVQSPGSGVQEQVVQRLQEALAILTHKYEESSEEDYQRAYDAVWLALELLSQQKVGQ